eukprot:1602985-Rhodomonas_salina.1
MTVELCSQSWAPGTGHAVRRQKERQAADRKCDHEACAGHTDSAPASSLPALLCAEALRASLFWVGYARYESCAEMQRSAGPWHAELSAQPTPKVAALRTSWWSIWKRVND